MYQCIIWWTPPANWPALTTNTRNPRYYVSVAPILWLLAPDWWRRPSWPPGGWHQATSTGATKQQEPPSTRCHLPPELRRKCSAALLNSNMWTLCEHCSLHFCMWAVAMLIYNNKITVHISVSHAKVRLIVRQGTCTNCVTCPSLQGAHLVFSCAAVY